MNRQETPELWKTFRCRPRSGIGESLADRWLLEALLAEPIGHSVTTVCTPVRRQPRISPRALAGTALLLGVMVAAPVNGVWAAARPAVAPAAPVSIALAAPSRPTVASRYAGVSYRPAARAALAQVDDLALLSRLLGEELPSQRSGAVAAVSRLAHEPLSGGLMLDLPVVPGANPAATAQQTLQPYVVQAGDSLWSIAERVYGDGNYWPLIYNANLSVVGEDPNLIFSSQRLTIPAKTSTLPAPITTSATTSTGNTQQAVAAAGSYTVVSGDTLSAIAYRQYGDATRWPDIFAANRGSIADPNWIYPGQVFVLP